MSQSNRRMSVARRPWAKRPGIWCCVALAWSVAGITALKAQSPTSPGVESRTVNAKGATLRLSPLAAEMIEDSQSPVSDDSANLRREGTQLREERGRFEFSGDRIAFITAETKTRFIGLENLNLQRIAQISAGSADSLEWTVSGVITEFQGTNYLLVTRAALATASTARRRSF